MINTRELRKIVDLILNKEATKDTIIYLKNVINYSDSTLFANINFLINNIPDDNDGIYTKSVLKDFRDCVSDQSNMEFLAKFLNSQKGSIEQLLNFYRNCSKSSTIKKVPLKIEKVFNSDSITVNNTVYNHYIEYDFSTETLIEHLVGESNV